MFKSLANQDANLRATLRQLPGTLGETQRALGKTVANTGTVFDALSQRDGQPRGLIESSNRVFETTGARDQELKDTFRALPTFNAEARRTVVRLSDFSDKTDPLISQLRPAARELSPTLIHYLRTTNPTNPESLAVYPRRIGSNRTNAYEMPGAFDQLATGLPSFETRHYNAGTPRVDQAALQSCDLPQEVKDGIQPYFFTNAPQVPRPPCRQQGRYTTGGRTTQYPQVQASGGRVARSAGK